MASKSESHDTRLRNRVRAFLDMVQESTGKKAIKACSDLAAEFPNAHLAKAALSVAYIRMGNIKQSETICEEATAKTSEWIQDSSAAYYYTGAMKSLERMDLLEAVCEKAVALDKKSVAHLEKLFAACLRTGNSAKQITSAMELWKLTNDDKYLMWSLVARAAPEMRSDWPRRASIVACSTPERPADLRSIPNINLEVEAAEAAKRAASKILQLSYMMFDTKFLSVGKVTKHLDIDFMLRLLIQTGQNDKALELLRSEYSKKLYGIEFQRLNEEAALLLLLGRTDEAIEAYKTLLTSHNADEWSWYSAYFNAVFGTPRPVESSKLTSELVSKATEFVKSLQSKADNGIKLRGPFVAELELEAITNPSNFRLDLLISFYNSFSSKPSCYRDMLPYLRYLKPEETLKLLEVTKPSKSKPEDLPAENSTLSAYGTLSTYKSLVRTLKAYSMTQEARQTEIKDLWTLYNHARTLNFPREATERFCADDLLLMLAHYHCDAYGEAVKKNGVPGDHVFAHKLVKGDGLSPVSKENPLHHLVLAAIALEHGVAHSKWNFQFRLLLNEVYIALGSVRSCVEQFDGVDVKHVQLDSVGYAFTDALYRYGSSTDANKIYKRATLFYEESRRSTADWAFEAYQKGAYHKVKEVLEFADKLNQSANRNAVRLEHLFMTLAESQSTSNSLSLITTFDPQQKIPKTLESTRKLSKNHDGEAMDWWAIDVPQFKHVEIPSGSVRSSTYPDAKQDYRILANSILASSLAILAEYQPVAPGEKPLPAPSASLDSRLAPLVPQLEEALQGFTQGKDHESLIWYVVLHSLKLVLAMYALSPLLTADKPDAANVANVKDSVTAISQGYQQLQDLLASFGSRIVSTANVALVTPFLTRSLVLLPFCLPLLPKLLPGKAKPKTPEEVKSQTSTLKLCLKDVAESSRKILTHLEQILQQEAESTANFEIQSLDASDVQEVISPKTVSRVIEGLVYSRRDTHQTLLTMVQTKIREYKSL